jgi:short-subunit dehydrogenase
MRFRGQTVWITGASSGIGEALTREFAGNGARLVLSGRRADELHRVRQSCAEADSHVVLPFDVRDSASFPRIVAALLEQVGKIDILVNNAGVSQRALALQTAESAERALMEVDYFGPVALSKAVLPAMLARKAGHLVVVSSVMGYVGTPGRSTYAAAKHALHGYFESLRAELSRENIAITLACPGYVKTNIGLNAFGPDSKPTANAHERTPRGVTPEHCARKIVRAVAGRRREVYIGREAIGIYLQRFFPTLMARIARNMPAPTERT